MANSCPDPIATDSIAIPVQTLAINDPIVAIPGQPLATTDPNDAVPGQILAISNPIADVSITNPSQSLATDGSLFSRRPPPPCWTHEEILALIDCYYQKWYSLRRSNLRSLHWEEVAVAISHICEVQTPKMVAVAISHICEVQTPKISLQCRNKMDKFRKRRSEKKHSLERFPSEKPWSFWVYFSKMEAMENGSSNSLNPSPVAAPPVVDVEEYDVVRCCRDTTLNANCHHALGSQDPKACRSKLDPSHLDGRGAQLRRIPNPRGRYGEFGGTKLSKFDGSGVDGRGVLPPADDTKGLMGQNL